MPSSQLYVMAVNGTFEAAAHAWGLWTEGRTGAIPERIPEPGGCVPGR